MQIFAQELDMHTEILLGFVKLLKYSPKPIFIPKLLLKEAIGSSRMTITREIELKSFFSEWNIEFVEHKQGYMLVKDFYAIDDLCTPFDDEQIKEIESYNRSKAEQFIESIPSLAKTESIDESNLDFQACFDRLEINMETMNEVLNESLTPPNSKTISYDLGQGRLEEIIDLIEDYEECIEFIADNGVNTDIHYKTSDIFDEIKNLLQDDDLAALLESYELELIDAVSPEYDNVFGKFDRYDVIVIDALSKKIAQDYNCLLQAAYLKFDIPQAFIDDKYERNPRTKMSLMRTISSNGADL